MAITVANKKELTIYEAMQNINSGNFVIPAFQRDFVWSLPQIEKLWDSILSGYPISTFLFWRINEENSSDTTVFRVFPSEYYFNDSKQSKKNEYRQSTVDFNMTNTAVLDGQQRLTALYLSLFGDILMCYKNARNNDATRCELLIELDKTKLEDEYDIDNASYNSKQYDIKITKKIGGKSLTQFQIKDILSERFRNDATRDEAIENQISGVSMESKEYARNILKNLYSKIFVEPVINYLDLVDTSQDDALEVFVRFNSAGKPLKKHEITTAILEVYWPGCKQEFEKVLTGNYAGFGEDFIIRTALMLFSKNVVKSNIDRRTADQLKNNWEQLKIALDNVKTILNEFNIKVERFASGWNILLPVIYAVYGNRINMSDANAKKGIFIYIVRAVLFKYFSFGTTAKLAKLKTRLDENDKQFNESWLDGIPEFVVNEFKLDTILALEKNDKVAAEALFYLSRSWLSDKVGYEIDHLHPRAVFATSIYGVSDEERSKMSKDCDTLPNLWLLEGTKNASKNDDSLERYFANKTTEQQQMFIQQAMIPEGISLEVRYFNEFFEKRKEILKEKLNALLKGEA